MQLAALMLAVALPISIAHLLQSKKQMAEVRDAAEARIEQAAQLMANRTDDWVETANASFLSLADPVRRNWDDRATLDSLLAVASAATNERFINFFVVDTLGFNRGSGRPTPDRDTINFLERDYFRAALRSNGPVVGAPRQSFLTSDRPWVVIMARALRDPDGRAYGVIASPVRIDTLTDFINVPSFRRRPLVTLLDTSGTIVARSESPERYIGHNVFSVTGQRSTFPDTTVINVIPGTDGVQRLTASTRSRRAPWLVNVGLPVDDFEAPLRAQQRDDLLMSLAALILAAVGAAFIGGRITRPLVSLASDVQQIADGASDHRAAVVGPSEVQMASAAVNRMAEAAQQRNEALADNEQRYRFLFESNPLPMWAWHADTMEILAVNDAVLEKYGYRRDTLLGRPITTLLDPSELDRFSKRRLPFTEDKQSAGTWKHRSADGRVMEMEIITTSSRRLGAANWLSIGIDVTARKEAEIALARSEEQLRQSQKMEAIGAFAGGIAHDFNNLLTGIVGFSEIAMDQLSPDDPTRADIAEVLSLAERGAELTRQILAVSRKQVLQPTTLDLNAVVADLERLFARLVGEHITVTTQCDPLLGMISADRGQLEQVMLNLVANARDAMPHGGTLTIETQSVSKAEAAQRGLSEGEWCVLEVRDTGVGMSDAIRERIFEPFFTTKERGKGTGLGLSLAYAMLAQIGGVITCESAPGLGSTFRLCFPRERFATGEHRTSKAQNGEIVGGTETILLAEDEASVRKVATATLERAGYLVLAAQDGPTALAMARAYASPIHLLLTDVVMPGMHGRELADLLLAERPESRVLFMSGYTDDAVLLRGIRIEEVSFQQKPFTPRQLAQRVRDVLDAPIVRPSAIAVTDVAR